MRLMLCSLAVLALVAQPSRADVAPDDYDEVAGKAWGTLLESALAIQKLSGMEKKSAEDEKKIAELDKRMDDTVKPLTATQRRVVGDLAGAYHFKQNRYAARDEGRKKELESIAKAIDLIRAKLAVKSSSLTPGSGGTPIHEGLAGGALALALMLAGLMIVRQRA